MPLTKLDEVRALIVTDLRKGIVGLPTVRPLSQIIGRCSASAAFPRTIRRPGNGAAACAPEPNRKENPQ